MNVTGPTVEMQQLARRLAALETVDGQGESDRTGVLRVCEKLSRPVSTLAGKAGFRALLMRALAVARVENKALVMLHVKPDGYLDGVENISQAEWQVAGIVLIAHLIGLFVTFIGEALTIQLIQEQWPDLPGSAPEGSQTR